MLDDDTYSGIYRRLDGIVALAVASSTPMRKEKGERDTAFVKRIVAHYLMLDAELKAAMEKHGRGDR